MGSLGLGSPALDTCKVENEKPEVWRNRVVYAMCCSVRTRACVGRLEVLFVAGTVANMQILLLFFHATSKALQSSKSVKSEVICLLMSYCTSHFNVSGPH